MNLAIAPAGTAVTAVGALMNNGTLRLYTGTIPVTPETAIGAQVLLATFTFAATAFGAPTFAGGLSSANAAFVANSVLPGAAGTVTWARALQSNGTAVVADFTVGATGTDIIVANTALVTTINVTITSFQLQMPAV
jgi:hypothetical protein